jgi:hypothetical protein
MTRQGDQIGRIFAYWAVYYFWQLFDNYRRNKKIGLLFTMEQATYVLILTKKGWATFWAIFSQTHLVTLVRE